MRSYKDLMVWQKGTDLVVEVYRLTKGFPKTEIFGIVSQMRRAAISIPSNIAEGHARKTNGDFAHFIRIASASGAELETQLLLVKRLGFVKALDVVQVETLLNEIMRMLNSLNSTISSRSKTNR